MDAYTQGQALRFREKPKPNGVISAGSFVFNRRLLDYLGRLECIVEREPLERLAWPAKAGS